MRKSRQTRRIDARRCEWMRDGRMDVKIMNNNTTETQRCDVHDKPDERMRGDVKIMANQVNGYMTI